jgi:hypothetical protein
VGKPEKIQKFRTLCTPIHPKIGEPENKKHLGIADVDERILLKWSLKNWV